MERLTSGRVAAPRALWCVASVQLAALSMSAAMSGRPARDRPRFAAAFKDGAVVQGAVNAAIAAGAPVVQIAPGNYSFGAAPFVVAGATQLKVVGAGVAPHTGTHLWFAPGFGVEVLASTDISVQGFTTDSLTPTYSQGKVLSVSGDGHTLTMQVEPGFPLPDGRVEPIFNATCADGSSGVCSEVKMIYWDAATRRMWQGQQMNSPMKTAVCEAEKASGTRCTVTTVAPMAWAPPPGSLLTLSPRIGATNHPIPSFYKGTLLVFNSTRVLLEDVDTYAVGDMARVENLGGGGHTYRRVNVKRRLEPPYAPRLLASNTDGFHSFSVEKGALLEDCEFGFLGDDFLNFHDRLLPIASVAAGGSVLRVTDVSDIYGHGTLPGKGAPTHTMAAVVPGDVVKLYSADSHTFLGSVAVKAAHRISAAAPPLPTALQNRVEPSAIQLWEVTTATARLPGIGPYEAVAQIDRLASRGAIVRNCDFHDSYNNVGRLAASDLIVENNTFERAGDGIHVSYDISGSFLEGSLGLHNISVVNNTFIAVTGCGSARNGAHGCADVCSNISCVLSHIDVPGVLTASGNVVRIE